MYPLWAVFTYLPIHIIVPVPILLVRETVVYSIYSTCSICPILLKLEKGHIEWWFLILQLVICFVFQTTALLQLGFKQDVITGVSYFLGYVEDIYDGVPLCPCFNPKPKPYVFDSPLPLAILYLTHPAVTKVTHTSSVKHKHAPNRWHGKESLWDLL